MMINVYLFGCFKDFYGSNVIWIDIVASVDTLGNKSFFSRVSLFSHAQFMLKPDEFGHEIKISSYVNKIAF